MAAAVAGVPTLLHRLLHHRPSRSFFLISSAAISKQPQLRRLLCHSLPSTKASLQQQQPTQQLDENAPMGLDSENGEEGETEAGKLDTNDAARMNLDPSTVLKRNQVDTVDLPTLTVREKKELASYANSLGKKLKSQLVGKSGVTPNVATAFVENLESNELLKVKIHGTCPEELDDTVKELEAATGSVVVGQIGRTVILYRPSLTKLKAEEKKEQMRKIFLNESRDILDQHLWNFRKKEDRGCWCVIVVEDPRSSFCQILVMQLWTC